MINKPNTILQQIYLRTLERHAMVADSKKMSKMGEFNIDFKKEKDSFCFSKTMGPIKIKGTSVESLNTFKAITLGTAENYFDEPLQSSSGLGIILCSTLDEREVDLNDYRSGSF